MDVEAHERCDGSGIWEISCTYSTHYTVAQVRQSAQSAIAVVVSLYSISSFTMPRRGGRFTICDTLY